MKKLQLKTLELGKMEVLDRKQMREILGGVVDYDSDEPIDLDGGTGEPPRCQSDGKACTKDAYCCSQYCKQYIEAGIGGILYSYKCAQR